MAGSKKWLRAMHGQKCEVCDTRMTEYAIKELRFELLPRQDGPGYAAVKTTMTAHCPTCGNAWSKIADALKPADMKSGIGWLIDRTRHIINPFTKEPIEFGESLPSENDGDNCTCEFDEKDDDGDSDDDDDDNGQDAKDGKASTQTADDPAKPPPKDNKRGRLLTQPSIRGCCPPTPITDHTLAAARRKLRCYSDIRTKPSFQRLMKQFGVRVRQDGQPLGSDDPDE